ncbi:MAG: phosphate ABC transporter ATP-binding protein [Anaerolineales bacterium]|nr:MAG: phosphate ABC transporter ATP-binding protein [Anaerolineales bacterium]
MSSQPKISIQNLTFSYNGTDLSALTDINLDIQSNEITVLFGPAQSGTSTLLRLLNRLNDLIEGTTMTGQILLDGQDIYAPGVNVVELRRQVGMVFALPIPLPATIRENITYGPRLSGVRDQHRLAEMVERSLRAAALWDEVMDRLDESASALSGGQQQRLCLARVLALEPEVILLDNPTSGLDPISTAKVEGSLQALKRDYTIVMVPHSIQQAARVADTAAFLLMGELVEHAPGEELFTWPRDKRTEDYITGRFG